MLATCGSRPPVEAFESTYRTLHKLLNWERNIGQSSNLRKPTAQFGALPCFIISTMMGPLKGQTIPESKKGLEIDMPGGEGIGDLTRLALPFKTQTIL